MGAGGIGSVASVAELLHAEHVVDELGPAVLDVQRPAAEAAALGDDHAVGGAVLRCLDRGGDGERLVLDVDDAVLAAAASCRGRAPGVVPVISCGRPAMVGVEPLEAAVVDRQHVVLDRLDQPEPLQLRAASRASSAARSSAWVQSVVPS